MYLLAKPDDWRIRPKQLADECGVHFTTIYDLLTKLIKAGYVKRDTIIRQKPNGTFDSGSIYTVYEDKRRGNLDRIPF
jgi:Mn-dependent DtxR family transcriptional regulator